MTRDLINAGNAASTPLQAGTLYSEASRRLDDILANSSGFNFRANYQKGLALVDLADLRDPDRHIQTPAFETAIRMLIDTANKLDRVDPVCAQKMGYYAIYSAIGTEYLGRSAYAASEKYLLKAVAVSQYTPAVNQTVDESLGLIYLLKKDFVSAHNYYTKALGLGSNVAAGQLKTVVSLGGAGTVTDRRLVAAATHPNLSGTSHYWVHDTASDCWAFDWYPVSGETMSWQGACVDHLASGQGTTIWKSKDGRVLEELRGTFVAGALNGEGVANYGGGSSFKGGSTYNGTWVYSIPQGFATATYADGEIVEGFWPGRGRSTFPNGIACNVVISRPEASSGRVSITNTTCWRI